MQFLLLILTTLLFMFKGEIKQQILSATLDKYLQKNKCFSQSQFLKTYSDNLYKKMLLSDQFNIQKKLLDKVLSTKNIYRVWKNLNTSQYQICPDPNNTNALYTPHINTTQVPLGVKEIFQNYPYLYSNVYHQRITELLSFLPQSIKNKYQLKRIIIFNNQMTVRNYPSGNPLTNYQNYITPYINELPNMDFIISVANQLHPRRMYEDVLNISTSFAEYDGKLEQYKRILIELPIFMFSKDITQWLEFNKLLLVDSNKLDNDWADRVKDIDEGRALYKWEDKIDKAFYRSGVSGLPYDDVVVNSNVPLYFTRLHLVNISRNNPDKVEAEFSGNQTFWNEYFNNAKFQLSPEILPDIAWKQLPKYKYLISMEGWTASKFKIALILHSNSVLMKQETGKVSWYFHLMKPYKHYIPLDRTLDNLLDQVDFARKNETLVKQIIYNANQFFKQHLMPQAVKSKLVKILKQYAKIQNYQLDYLDGYLYHYFNIIDQNQRKIIRTYTSSGIIVLFLCIISFIFVRNKLAIGLLSHTHQRKSNKYQSFNHIAIQEEGEVSQVSINHS